MEHYSANRDILKYLTNSYFSIKTEPKTSLSGACPIIDDPVNLVYYDQLGNQDDPIFLTIGKPEQKSIHPEGRRL